MDDMLDREVAALPKQTPGALVRLSGVHKYHGNRLAGRHALRGIDLNLHQGEMVALCGPSGSGKTSLLNIVGMLAPVNQGSVIVGNVLVSSMSDQARAHMRARMFGFVFQAFSLIPIMTARDNIVLPLLMRGRLHHTALRAAYARADDLLDQLGLGQHTGTYPTRLDPGQRQRVAIARSLIARPRLVIADEPAAQLDAAGTRLMLNLFAREQCEQGTSFLISMREQRVLAPVTRSVQLEQGLLQPDSARLRMVCPADT